MGTSCIRDYIPHSVLMNTYAKLGLQMVDPTTAVKDGSVSLKRVLSLDEVKSFIVQQSRAQQ